MKWGERPVIVLGHGIRASGADASLLLEIGVPVVSSWQAADLVDNWHPMYFGRPGIYGQRAANKVFYEADQLISIGCRLTPWMIGHGGLRPEQKLVMVDVDKTEVARFPQAQWINEDAARFIENIKDERPKCPVWECRANGWKSMYPWIEAAHADTNGYVNSYRFIEHLQKILRPDEIITVDIGALMCPVFQGLRVKPPQRILTSGGLGEMGCALPAAIGASFATGKGEVMALVGDGGMMMNIQELQTIAHHKLPIKIIVFENDGYAMIKGTHRNIKIPYTGVTRESGVSMPDFCAVAAAFDIGYTDARTWGEAKMGLSVAHQTRKPYLLQLHIDPEQAYFPRLQPIIGEDGKITPARFDQLSPR